MKSEVEPQVPLPNGAPPPAERREDERSESERSGVGGGAGANAAAGPRPDPEVAAKAKRRRFTAKYKQDILEKADAAASKPGGIGGLLRREGLYSSSLVQWRRDRKASVQQGLEPRKRGPKLKQNPLTDENEKLQRENARLTEQLRKAELIIDVQKKVAALLGPPIPGGDHRKERR